MVTLVKNFRKTRVEVMRDQNGQNLTVCESNMSKANLKLHLFF